MEALQPLAFVLISVSTVLWFRALRSVSPDEKARYQASGCPDFLLYLFVAVGVGAIWLWPGEATLAAATLGAAIVAAASIASEFRSLARESYDPDFRSRIVLSRVLGLVGVVALAIPFVARVLRD